MALSAVPPGYVDPAVVENWVTLAAERGLTLEEVAVQVEPESALLAHILRERAEAAAARQETPEQARTQPPKGRKTPSGSTS